MLRGRFAHDRQTVQDLINVQRLMGETNGANWGEEMSSLVPLSIQLVLYLAAREPDLEWIPPERLRRPQQIRETRIGDIGWRVGSALRTWRRETASSGAVGQSTVAGWSLPPHIRRAHWHRVRVATRDAAGNIIGNRSGEQGTDWQYEMRWFPPTPVNMAVEGLPTPTIRDVAVEHEERA